MRDASINEWLDADTISTHDLERNLRDIRHINAMLGWTAFTTRAVLASFRRQPQRAWTLIDVASGSADIPMAIARASVRSGIDLHVTATDRNPQIVAVARERSRSLASMTVEAHDALALPYPDGSFDVALCTLALHHFAPEAAVQLLQSMARVGQRVVVCDVVRSPLAYAGVVALTRLGGMHAMTCHDGPVSVRRAYSAEEVREMAHQAGLRNAQVRVDFPFRLMLTAAGTATSGGPDAV